MAGAATGGAIEDGHTLCGSTESRTEKSAAGSETKRIDLRRRRGGSSTRESPRAETRGTARRTGGLWGGRSDGASQGTGRGGRMRQGRRWRN